MLPPGLRGAAALKQRVADLRGISSSSNAMAMGISAGIQKGTTLRVCLPCGERPAEPIVAPCSSTLQLMIALLAYMQGGCG